VDAILSYVDFSNVHAEPRFAQGQQDAFTAPPCHGVAFFTGTPVDGPGMSPVLGFFAKKIAHGLRQYRLSHPEKYSDIDNAYYQRLYAAQGPKAILLEAEKKQILGQPLEKLAMPDLADPLVKELKAQARRGAIKQSALVPSVLPLQIIRLGRLAIVCAPGEFTTTAGERLRATVEESLKDIVDTVLICTYCNEYMGYVTTFEEYQVQAYEGGHTIFGQWTLAGFQTCFSQLATQLKQPLAARTHDQKTRPALPPAHELNLRSNLAVPR
jgi:neutral ceramidase